MVQPLKTKTPYLFTLCKRFLRSRKIKYTYFPGAFTIAAHAFKDYPPLIYSFSEGRVRIAPIPITGWSIDISAQTFEEIIEKIGKHQVTLRKAANV